LNSKLHAICDRDGRPLVMLPSEGQMSDHRGARLTLEAFPPAESLIPDKGYDSNCFRQALVEKGIAPRIPSNRTRKRALPYDRRLYKIENMFGRIKDWRRIATRYDRCAHSFFSAICIAATVAFWL
jgi:putative transposase